MTKALVIVDVQNDFVEGGSLAVEGGRDLASRLVDWLQAEAFENYDLIVTTQDWHIDPGTHFSDNPDFIDSWPVHCRANTDGGKIVPELASALEGHVDLAVKKGRFEAAYSGFEGVLDDDSTLAEALENAGVTEVDVCGIAGNYCVKQTALDGISSGFKTTVLSEFIVSIPNGSEKSSFSEMEKAGVRIG